MSHEEGQDNPSYVSESYNSVVLPPKLDLSDDKDADIKGELQIADIQAPGESPGIPDSQLGTKQDPYQVWRIGLTFLLIFVWLCLVSTIGTTGTYSYPLRISTFIHLYFF